MIYSDLVYYYYIIINLLSSLIYIGTELVVEKLPLYDKISLCSFHHFDGWWIEERNVCLYYRGAEFIFVSSSFFPNRRSKIDGRTNGWMVCRREKNRKSPRTTFHFMKSMTIKIVIIIIILTRKILYFIDKRENFECNKIRHWVFVCCCL